MENISFQSREELKNKKERGVGLRLLNGVEGRHKWLMPENVY